MNSAYLSAYPEHTVQQVASLLQQQALGPWLLKKYPKAHGLRDDKSLYAYVQGLRQEFLRNAPPVSRVQYDSKLQLVHNALGIHANIARVQGSQLKAKREIRIGSLFRDAPAEFLRMIAVHELAHLREREHDKNFYALCCHMEPHYHQLEFEVRVYLTYLDAKGAPLWR